MSTVFMLTLIAGISLSMSSDPYLERMILYMLTSESASTQPPLLQKANPGVSPEAKQKNWTEEESLIHLVARPDVFEVLLYNGRVYNFNDPKYAWLVKRGEGNKNGKYFLREELWARVDSSYPFPSPAQREYVLSQLRIRGLHPVVSSTPRNEGWQAWQALRKRKSENLKKFDSRKRPKIKIKVDSDERSESDGGLATQPCYPAISQDESAPPSEVTSDAEPLKVLSGILGDLREQVRSQKTEIDTLTEANHAKDHALSDLQSKLSDLAKAGNISKVKRLEEEVAKLKTGRHALESDFNQTRKELADSMIARGLARKRADQAEKAREKLQAGLDSEREILAIYDEARNRVARKRQEMVRS
ncbi:uncharacterized protein RCO7_02088 [Rhynchosporium graminicola]|uniref:Uncharacterized protein n=1 Tax=Rhynchosporium graminicola TaxID=2792576 RepID=A0A1E1KTR8_9HELO|nr:uncharacterized protein RCO7_02088 [Rhynchosporium commune]